VTIPFAPGGASDFVGRIIQPRLSELLGQQIIIENRPGAAGIIGTQAAARAVPDGYTFLVGSSAALASNPFTVKSLPYDPVKDFVPIALVGVAPYVLTVYPNLPAKNLAELLALAKAKPKTLNYSSVGNASLGHLATELMASMAGVQLNHVPYRATGPAVLDLSEGRIDITFGLLGSNLPLIREGKIRPLALSSARRMDDVPDVPTMAEAGLPGFEASLWFAVVAPAALPAAIVNRLNREINAILGEADVKRALAAQATQIELSTPEKLRELIRADIEKWRAVANKLGIKPE